MDPQLRKLVENEAHFRAANERIRDSAISFAFTQDQRVPFLCECSDIRCREVVMLSLPVYERIRSHPDRFVLCAGHEDEDGRLERVIEAEQGYAVIEKFGEASAEATRLDKRTG